MQLPAWCTISVALLILAFFTCRHCVIQNVIKFFLIITVGATLTVIQRSKTEMSFPSSSLNYQAVVTSRPVLKGKTVRCDMTIMNLGNQPIHVKAYFSIDERSKQLRIGNGVNASSVLKEPSNFNGSTFDYRRYLLFHGYSATTFILRNQWESSIVNLKSMSITERLKLKALIFRERLLSKYLQYGLSEQDYAVLSAMTLGDKTAISRSLANEYSISGASHVLALSGLHLGIIFTVLTFLFSQLRIRMFNLILVICAIWAYVFIVGMSPSVLRSAVMLTIYSFVNLFNRDNLSLNTLALAAVILLAISPLDLYDVGFQMSFMSVLFIILFFRHIYHLMPLRFRQIKAVRTVWQMASVSIAAQAGVAPLVALYFQRFSCYFLLTNFLVIPLATVILYCAVFLVLTTAIPVIQHIVSTLLLTAVKWLNVSVSFIASWPGASIEGIHINYIQVICYYIIIGEICILIYYAKRMLWFKRKPFTDFKLNKEWT